MRVCRRVRCRCWWTIRTTAGLVVNPVVAGASTRTANGSFTVRLATLPTHSVSVSVGSGDVGAATVSPTPLVFATQDWGTAQTVTVTGVADVDAWDETVTVSLSATSDDSDYEGETGQVSVSVDDDETAGLVVSLDTLEINEDGNGSFTVRLATQPSVSVSVSVGSNDSVCGNGSVVAAGVLDPELGYGADRNCDRCVR